LLMETRLAQATNSGVAAMVLQQLLKLN